MTKKKTVIVVVVSLITLGFLGAMGIWKYYELKDLEMAESYESELGEMDATDEDNEAELGEMDATDEDNEAELDKMMDVTDEDIETNYENYEAYLDVKFPSDGKTCYKVIKKGATFFSDVDMCNQIKNPAFCSIAIEPVSVRPEIYSYRLDNGKICYSPDCFDDPANWSDTNGGRVK